MFFSSSVFASINLTTINSFADIVEPLLPTVVNIYSTKYIKANKNYSSQYKSPFDNFNDLFEKFGIPFGFEEMYDNPKATSLGSGFIIDSSGYIVTNHHVIANADEIHVKLNDKTELPAKLIGSDSKTDIALLKIIHKQPLPFVKFGDSNKARVGDWVIAIGNPFGLSESVTTGIISAKARDIDVSGGIVDDFIQTDAAINQGNSGGPLFNLNGEVIAVSTAIYSPSASGGNIGIGFGIPANTVQIIIAQLKQSGKVVRGMLNIGIQEITSEIAEGLGLKEVTGVLVNSVEPGGAGDKSGLKSGDIIVEFNGIPVKSMRKLQILVAETPINKEVKIIILREGQTKQLSVNIPEEGEASGYIELNDVLFSNLGDDIKKQFDDTFNGIVVAEVKHTSRWYRLLQKGDIITSVNQQSINSVSEFKKIYERAKSSHKKTIVVMLKRGINMTLFLGLPL